MMLEIENLFFTIQDLKVFVTTTDGIQNLKVVGGSDKRLGIVAIV